MNELKSVYFKNYAYQDGSRGDVEGKILEINKKENYVRLSLSQFMFYIIKPFAIRTQDYIVSESDCKISYDLFLRFFEKNKEKVNFKITYNVFIENKNVSEKVSGFNQKINSKTYSHTDYPQSSIR